MLAEEFQDGYNPEVEVQSFGIRCLDVAAKVYLSDPYRGKYVAIHLGYLKLAIKTVEDSLDEREGAK